jgi:hypothetical protein
VYSQLQILMVNKYLILVSRNNSFLIEI